MDQASRIIARSFLRRGGDSDLIQREAVACRSWKKAAGHTLAKHTRAAKLVRGTLVIEADDENWCRHLWGFRKQILKNLEQAIGPDIVSDLEFRVMPPRIEPRRAVVLAPPDEASDIADPGLRRNYIRARAKANGA